MADPAPATLPSANGAAIVLEQPTTLLLKDEDENTTLRRRGSLSITNEPNIPESPLDPRSTKENAPPPNRRPLFGSMREALESSGQVKEEPGGYVIKRHSGPPQQHYRSGESARGRAHNKQRPSKGSSKTTTFTTPNPEVEDEADAAGYTVIRRRSSCDEDSLSASTSAATPSHPQAAGRRNPRAYKKQQQQQQRPRRGSMSAVSMTSSLQASMTPQASSSVPPGFQPRPSSHVLRPPPGLTPAASGWVVKAAAPAENANRIEEPPVEALWPEMQPTAKTDSGWAIATSIATASLSTSESGGLQAQAWSSSAERDGAVDDDLLARLGVTL